MAAAVAEPKSADAKEFSHQAERLSLLPRDNGNRDNFNATTAVEAKFITPQDPVIETSYGGRLPAVPFQEAQILNTLKAKVEGRDSASATFASSVTNEEKQSSCASSASPPHDTETLHELDCKVPSPHQPQDAEPSLRSAVPSSRTNPLFPQLPLYGPPTFMRNLHCTTFRASSFFLSLAFLGVIVLGSVFTSIPLMLRNIGLRLTFRNPDARRPFYVEEQRRKKIRQEESKAWKRSQRRRKNCPVKNVHNSAEGQSQDDEFKLLEGGKDPLVCDAAYYARRVGLDMEEFKVITEDGFIITLWHVYDPREYTPVPEEKRQHRNPEVFPKDFVSNGHTFGASGSQYVDKKRRYPVLLVHGLLQSAGAYCSNDDDSLAFFLCKSGYDVWLGNNRCGFKPEHQLLEYSDPRMWAWNIRQMGVMDLPALISRVLSETGFEKLGLVCHSQGTTQTFVALAKEQRPDLGKKISVFCALAPAVYAGPLIGKMYFKFMRVISPNMFRVFFGIHAFIPFMMTMHSLLPGRLYGALGYRVFSFLFNWTDDRWDQGLRDRLFQFAPVYVSAESMRWWLGRECFARQKCILATREEGKIEDEEDAEENDYISSNGSHFLQDTQSTMNHVDMQSHGRTAWYDEQVPPFALWIGGSDELVDGRRLLRRLERGREPFVRVVHSKVIEEYEHLDVIWAMDSIDKVGKEVREVIWKTTTEHARSICRIPKGCEGVIVSEALS